MSGWMLVLGCGGTMSHPDQAFGDKTYSQFGEDLILLNVFYNLGIKKGKYYILKNQSQDKLTN